MSKKLNVEYDEVVIIDTLPQNEFHDFQIVQDLSKFLQKSGIRHKIATGRNRKSVLKIFEHLVEHAASGVKFCLHIVSHGSESGLWMKTTDEDVYWHELRSYLSEMNTNMEGQLIVNMTSCWGLHAAKIVDATDASLPFFGVIGYADELHIRTAKQINELFYTKWLEGKPINIIVQEIRTELFDDKLYCISEEGYRDINEVLAA
jgi:hypothetical protein